MVARQVGFHFIDTQFGVFVGQCFGQFWGCILDDSGITFQRTIGGSTLCGLIEMAVDLDFSVGCLVRFSSQSFAGQFGIALCQHTCLLILNFTGDRYADIGGWRVDFG